LRRHHTVVAAGQNDIRTECDQLRRVFASTLGISGAPTLVNSHIATLDPARLPQAIQERCQTGLPFRTVGRAHERPEAPHWTALLRARRERPRSGRAAEQRDELAPRHSITSSAMARTPGGIVRPSDLATLRLISSSNLPDCTTGRSGGRAPLKILPL